MRSRLHGDRETYGERLLSLELVGLVLEDRGLTLEILGQVCIELGRAAPCTRARASASASASASK